MTEQTPSRRAGLRDDIAAAIEAADYSGSMRRGDLADSVMPVLYREWPWLRAEADEAGLTDPEVRAQLHAVIKALGASETENKTLRAAVTRVRALADRIRQGAPWTANDDDIAAHILAALDGDQAPTASCSPAAETRLAQAGVDTPGCDCGHDGMGVSWHGDDCPWRRSVLDVSQPKET